MGSGSERAIAAAAEAPSEGRAASRDDRQMLGAMLYVLRTGIQWNALPREIGASTTVYDRFRAWEADGFFARLWAAGLGEFDELVGIDWEWQSLDGVMTKAPFGRAATAEAEGIGHNPTDRGKHGTKRSTLSDGHGLPLAVVVAGANVHDLKLAAPTLDAVVVERPRRRANSRSTCVWMLGTTTTCHALPPSSAPTSSTSGHGVRSVPTPAHATRSSGRGGGWWSDCTVGSIAHAVYSCAGRNWRAPTWPSCSWHAPCSASSSATGCYGWPPARDGCGAVAGGGSSWSANLLPSRSTCS